ncbi:hypothetical protein SAMN04489761_0925 [Tenacibaculum sp. MAR_2009_124]|uniref:hypothetical protein n=1 Tax=Tenacibaculum sp. MAR_2009_124 TaxID=1250059 RepID=UPI000898FAD1|nr:hypothetical protein [Tenacibaculum sp. MAR_2009_124]SEB47389.1 hypothetical protein SAMN04489761_0925 [Tenacibaculum sp. MAR_2009_124]
MCTNFKVSSKNGGVAIGRSQEINLELSKDFFIKPNHHKKQHLVQFVKDNLPDDILENIDSLIKNDFQYKCPSFQTTLNSINIMLFMILKATVL